MKKTSLILLCLSALSLTACGTTSSVSSSSDSTSETSSLDTSTSTEGTKEETNQALENALEALKIGFQAKVSYKVSQYNSATDRVVTNFAKEVILKNDNAGKVYGERVLSFRADGAGAGVRIWHPRTGTFHNRR